MRSFAKAKRRCDLKIIRAEIATAPSELRNDNKKDYFSSPNLNYKTEREPVLETA